MAENGHLGTLRTGLDSHLTTRDMNRFFVSQAILDTKWACVKGLVQTPSTLADFAIQNTPEIFDWFRDWEYRPLNIVIIDWFTMVPDYVDFLVAMNLRGSILRSRIDVDDQGGGADIRSFGFQTTGNADGCTLELTFPGIGPTDLAFTPHDGPRPISYDGARVQPEGRLSFTTLRSAQWSTQSDQWAFISFDGTFATNHSLTVKSAILAVVEPPLTPVDTPLIRGFVNHSEFLVDDQGGGADNRNFVFDTVRHGDGVIVTITYPGAGPMAITLTRASPVYTIPDSEARVKPTDILSMEWPPSDGNETLLVVFSGVLHTEHSVTLYRIGVAILDPLA